MPHAATCHSICASHSASSALNADASDDVLLHSPLTSRPLPHAAGEAPHCASAQQSAEQQRGRGGWRLGRGGEVCSGRGDWISPGRKGGGGSYNSIQKTWKGGCRQASR
eukprot:352655-Chlamydomonas_euryale.AAC.1